MTHLVLQETNKPGNQQDTRSTLRQNREYSQIADEEGFNRPPSCQPRIPHSLEVTTKAFHLLQSRISEPAQVKCANRDAFFQKRSHLQ